MSPITLVLLFPAIALLTAVLVDLSRQKKRLQETSSTPKRYLADAAFRPQLWPTTRVVRSDTVPFREKLHARLSANSVAEIAAQCPEDELITLINHVTYYGPTHQLGLFEVAAEKLTDPSQRLIVARRLKDLNILGHSSLYLPLGITDSIALAVDQFSLDSDEEVAMAARVALDSPEMRLIREKDSLRVKRPDVLSATTAWWKVLYAAFSAQPQRALIAAVAVVLGALIYGGSTLEAVNSADLAGLGVKASRSAVVVGTFCLAAVIGLADESVRTARLKIGLVSPLSRPADSWPEKFAGQYLGPDRPASVRWEAMKGEQTDQWRSSLAARFNGHDDAWIVPSASAGVIGNVAEWLVAHRLGRIRTSVLSLVMFTVSAIFIANANWAAAGASVLVAVLIDVFDGAVVLASGDSATDRRHLVMWDYTVDRLGDIGLTIGGGVALASASSVAFAAVAVFGLGGLYAAYTRAESARFGVLITDGPFQRGVWLAVLGLYLLVSDPVAGFVVAGGLAMYASLARTVLALRT